MLEDDEIFVDFVIGSHDALVIEDADHVLKARTDGNKGMHRFLTVADGAVRSLGRKIIFTTNLHNLRDIDAALLRPGRCFALTDVRLLERHEAGRLADASCSGDAARRAKAASTIDAIALRGVSVAQVYRACGLGVATQE